MGNSASKATRAFPKRTPAPWSGARTPGPLEARAPPSSSPPPPTSRATARDGVSLASERRTAEIDEDARDPDFLAALNRLGPVRVDHSSGTQQQASRTTETQDTQMNKTARLFQSRAASEDEASSFKPAHNHLYAGSLHELLNERKSARTHRDLINLANRYNIDVDKMERLARFVTSPSVDNNLNVRKVDKNGGVFVTLTAVWANPNIQPGTAS